MCNPTTGNPGHQTQTLFSSQAYRVKGKRTACPGGYGAGTEPDRGRAGWVVQAGGAVGLGRAQGRDQLLGGVHRDRHRRRVACGCVCSLPAIGQEFVETVDGPVLREPGEHIGQIGQGVGSDVVVRHGQEVPTKGRSELETASEGVWGADP